jgi:tRNA(His) guanylyltransferase
MSNYSLAERMKLYEKNQSIYLPIRTPIIIRIDGRAFHTFTRGMDKPFDNQLINMMNKIGRYLCKEIAGVLFAYIQSDEINILLYYENPENRWFNNDTQKITSISAGLASAYAMKWKLENMVKPYRTVCFDSRVFTLPMEEVVNYFIWRQQDWIRNSVQMVARSLFSHKEILNKKIGEMREMIFIAGDNWNKLPTYLKNGRCIVEKKVDIEVDNDYFTGFVGRTIWEVDVETPVFTKDRDYIKNIIFQK